MERQCATETERKYAQATVWPCEPETDLKKAKKYNGSMK